MDVLPLYIVLMFFLPLILLMIKWRANLTLALSVALYRSSWRYDLYLTAYPNGFWSFNPFAWQLLFVFGAWCALGGAKRMSRILSSPITLWISLCLSVRGVLRHDDLVLPAAEPSDAAPGSSNGFIRSTRPISTCSGSRTSWRWRPLPCASCRRDGPA